MSSDRELLEQRLNRAIAERDAAQAAITLAKRQLADLRRVSEDQHPIDFTMLGLLTYFENALSTTPRPVGHITRAGIHTVEDSIEDAVVRGGGWRVLPLRPEDK